MKNRNPLMVFLLTLLTGGIYGWYWMVKTKGEMNKLGEKIPTAWIWLIPIIGNFWWLWKYAQGVEHVSKNELNMFLTLLALYLLGPIGMAIVQEAFNRTITPVIAEAPVSLTVPPVTVTPSTTTTTTTTTTTPPPTTI